MQTIPAAWRTAAQMSATAGRLGGQYSPIVLVDLLAVNRTFSTAAYNPGGPRTFDDGALFDSGVTFDDGLDAAETLIARLDEGGLGTLTIDLDEQTDAQRIGGMSVALLNQANLVREFESTVLDNTLVRVRLGFQGLGPTEFLTAFTGVLDRQTVTQELLTLSLIDASLRSSRNLSVTIGGQYFPGTPAANKDKAIPLLVGINVDAPTYQVAGEAQGSLGLALSSTATVLHLVEYGAPFPASGTISIGTETGVTYTARLIVTTGGVTYLRLSGLTRGGSPTSHAVGEAVTLTSVKYQYLIGYKVSALNTVRNNGAIVAPATYTLLTVRADRDVSVLEFTSAQGTVTVDVNAGDAVVTNHLTNGGFEAGDTSSWTFTGSGSAAVGTSSPAPFKGTYRLGITGGLNSYGRLFQDITTIAGERYLLTGQYQDSAPANLLTNGGFETQNLNGWTVTRRYGGEAFVQDPVAEGTYALEVGRPPAGSSGVGYVMTLFQEVTVTPTLSYRFSVQAIAANIWQTIQLIPQRAWVRVYLFLGTPSAPTLYLDNSAPWYWEGTYIQRGTTIFDATPAGNLGARRNAIDYKELSIVATVPSGGATTMRATIHVESFRTTVELSVPPLYLDAAALYQAGSVVTDEAAYAIGTPDDAESIVPTTTLERLTAWRRFGTPFIATGSTTRISLASRFLVSSHTSYFDEVQVVTTRRDGLNPATAIAQVIDTFLDEPRDTASFDAAYDALVGWQFGAVLAQPGESTTLLQRMASQCKSLVYQDQANRWRMVVLDQSRTNQFGFAPSNIVQGSWQRLLEPIDNVYTEIYVWWGAKTGTAGTSPSDFQAVAYATPTTTTHPSDASLPAQCQAGLRLYGRPHRLDIYAVFLADVTSAHNLLQWLVQRRTLRHSLLQFATWLDAFPLQLGDLVTVQHPTLPGDDMPALGEVVGWHWSLQRMTVELVVRTLDLAGWSADWDYAPTVLPGEGWASDFEYAATPDAGAGWGAEMEPDDLVITRHRRQVRRPLPDEDEVLPIPRRPTPGGGVL